MDWVHDREVVCDRRRQTGHDEQERSWILIRKIIITEEDGGRRKKKQKSWEGCFARLPSFSWTGREARELFFLGPGRQLHHNISNGPDPVPAVERADAR